MTSFAGDFFSILEDKALCGYSKSESEGSRTSFAGGCSSILDDMSVCGDSRSESESSRSLFAGGFFPIHGALDPACLKPCVILGHLDISR